MRSRAAAATDPTPIRTDLMQHERGSAFSAATPSRVLASLVARLPQNVLIGRGQRLRDPCSHLEKSQDGLERRLPLSFLTRSESSAPRKRARVVMPERPERASASGL